MRALRVGERLAWGIGIVLVLSYVGVRAGSARDTKSALQRFERAGTTVDFNLWSESRVQAYEESLQRDERMPLAVLRIRRIALEAPVLDAIDEDALNWAVGRIPGTGRPGEGGNLAIAGHRDGFFRGLKDLQDGDRIEVQTQAETEVYVIVETSIVDPDQTDVLLPTAEPSLTLVTCYPFYYVGPAPKRYIVRAVRSETSLNASNR